MKDPNGRARRAAMADRAHHDWWQWLGGLAHAQGSPESATAGTVTTTERTRARSQGAG